MIAYNIVMASPPSRRSRYHGLSAQAKLMLAAGESGRFEFKSNADAVKPATLASLANWIALNDDVEAAHLLVGVDEEQNGATGLVSGRVCGLPKGLEHAVARINDMASTTLPIPVDAFVIEEAVGSRKPFVRVEVRPTQPPHYDKEGRRQTRQGSSTRALTDDELLRIYLTREAGTFATRYRQISTELHAAVGNIGSQVDTLADGIDVRIAQPIEALTDTAESAAIAARAAENAADAIGSDVAAVEFMIRDLRDVVATLERRTKFDIAAQLRSYRRKVWWTLASDTWARTSARASKLAGDFKTMLEADVNVDEDRNTWELAVWGELLNERDDVQTGRITMRWWEYWRARLSEYFDSPAYAGIELPDLRGELARDFDAAVADPDGLVARFQQSLNY